MKYQIISDGSCDLELDFAKENGIEIMPFYVSLDGETYRKDKVELETDEFYQSMIDDPKLFPKSACPSVGDYVDIFERFVAEGTAVICICITEKFSGSYNSAINAKIIIEEKYPDAHVAVIDSESNTVTQGMLVLEAARMQKNGVDYGEAIKNIDRIKSSGRIFFTISSIDYLLHGGRIGKLAAFVGKSLNLKPMIIMENGDISAAGISLGRKASLQKVYSTAAQHFAKIGEKIENYIITVGYGYDYDESVSFRDGLTKIFGSATEIPIRRIGAVVGVHTGPLPLGIGVMKKYDA